MIGENPPGVTDSPTTVTRHGHGIVNSRQAEQLALTSSTMNDGQETFRRFAKQLRTVGGGGMPPGGKGLFAGSGLLIALVAGGFVLNASLFNGT